MNAQDTPDDRPLDELPTPYRAAVEAILNEPVPDVDLTHFIPTQLSIRPIGKRSTSSRSLGAILMRPRNFVTIGAAAALIMLISQLIPSSNGDFALAQVQEQVEKLHSIQYKETFQDPFSTQPCVRRIMGLGDSKTRWEEPPTPDLGRSVEIFDLQQEANGIKSLKLTIWPEKKACRLSVVLAPYDGKSLKKGDKLFTWRDTLSDLLRQPADKVKRLPEREIDGKTALGFTTEREEKSEGFVGTLRRTCWIDKKSKLPVRIELTSHSNDPNVKDRELNVLSDFIFDAPLDPALFSIDPPKGYKNLQPQASQPSDKPLQYGPPTGRFVPDGNADKPDNPGK